MNPDHTDEGVSRVLCGELQVPLERSLDVRICLQGNKFNGGFLKNPKQRKV